MTPPATDIVQHCLPPGNYESGKLRGMEIGDRIRQARVKAHLSQRELAEAIGVSHGLVGQWESHKKVPGRESLRKIAEITWTSPGYLLGGRFEHTPSGVLVTDEKQIDLLRRFARLSPRQQENLLELLGIAQDVRREMQDDCEPAET